MTARLLSCVILLLLIVCAMHKVEATNEQIRLGTQSNTAQSSDWADFDMTFIVNSGNREFTLTPSSAWLQALSSVSTIKTVNQTSSCELDDRGLILKFNTNTSFTVTCRFFKKNNVSVLGSSDATYNIQFPAIAYYTPSYDFLGNSRCGNTTATDCLGTLTIPIRSLGGDGVDLETTSEILFEECTPPLMLMIDSEQIIQHFIGFEARRYHLHLNGTVDIALQQSQTISCPIHINKVSPVTPYFNIQKNNAIIFTDSSIIRSSIQVDYNPDDCENLHSSVCTLSYITPLHNPSLTATTPFFYMELDLYPILDTAYIPTDDAGLERRYTQRFLKRVSQDPNNVKYFGSDFAPLTIGGTFTPTRVFNLNITKFAQLPPLYVEYDEGLCADPLVPFCRAIFKSNYTGLSLALRIDHLPFYGVVDRVDCVGNITYSKNSPLEFSLRSTFQNKNGIESENSVIYTQDSYCILDFALPLNGNSDVPQQEMFNIIALREVYKFNQDVLLTPYYPIHVLPSNLWAFETLPFTLESNAADCAAPRDPYCTLKLTIHAEGEDSIYPTNSTLEERREIFKHSYWRQMAFSMYDLKVPNTSYGETDFVKITITNNMVLNLDWRIEYASASYGFDILVLTPQLLEPEVWTYDNFFKWNNTTQKYEDVIITIAYDMLVPQDAANHVEKARDVYLLNYGVTGKAGNWPILFHAEPGEIFYAPLFALRAYDESCYNPHSAFCVIRFDSLLDPEKIKAAESYLKGFNLRSLVLDLPSSHFVGVDINASSRDILQQVTLLTPRVEDGSGGGKLTQMLRFNITVAPIGKDKVVELALVKRVGAKGLVKVDIPFFIAEIYQYHPVTNEVVGSAWMQRLMTFFYVIKEVQYEGDARFVYQNDCRDPSSIRCTWSIDIYTHLLYPNMDIVTLSLGSLHDVFYQLESLGCTGIENITQEDSLQYFDITPNDPIDTRFILRTTSKQSDMFHYDKPLRPDRNINPNTIIQCKMITWHTTRRLGYHAPAVVLRGIHTNILNNTEIALYPTPDATRYSQVFPPLVYELFRMEWLDDCMTAYQSASSCTYAYTVKGTVENPIYNLTGMVEAELFYSHPILGLSAQLAYFAFPGRCMVTTAAEDNNNDNNIIQQTQNVVVDGDDVIYNNFKFMENMYKEKEVLQSLIAHGLGHFTFDNIKQQLDLNTQQNNEEQSNFDIVNVIDVNDVEFNEYYYNTIYNNNHNNIHSTPIQRLTALNNVLHNISTSGGGSSNNKNKNKNHKNRHTTTHQSTTTTTTVDQTTTTSFQTQQQGQPDFAKLFGLSINDQNIVSMNSSLHTINGDTTSPIMGYYILQWSLCNTTEPLRMLIDIKPDYRTGTHHGYFFTTVVFADLALFGMELRQPVVPQQEFQLWPNVYIPDHVNWLDFADASKNITGLSHYTDIARKSPDRYAWAPSVMGRLVNVDSAGVLYTRKANRTITYQFTQPDIVAVDIYSIMADLTEDEYLECYEYDNIANERIENNVLARLYMNYGLQKTEMIMNTTLFYTNAYCQIDLPITHAYPTQTFGVLHEVYVKDHKDSYFTTWSYPQYKNGAEIQRGAGDYDSNTAVGMNNNNNLITTTLIIISIMVLSIFG